VNILPDVTVIIADTVGFIRHIPHDLIDAFHATLEETRQADLLLHVIDANDSLRHAHIEQVNQVIQQIGAAHIPQIEVYNKIDLQESSPRMEMAGNGQPQRVWLSAKTGAGMELLRDAVSRFVSEIKQRHRLQLPASAGKLRANLFNIGVVYHEQLDDEGGWIMEVNMETSKLHRLCAESGLHDIKLQSDHTTL
jgi:GTP-binding protein HflX